MALNPKVELTITGLFLTATIIAMVLTSQIDLSFSSDLETFSGPRAYPGIILSLLLLLFLSVGFGQLRSLSSVAEPNKHYQEFFSHRALYSLALMIGLAIFAVFFESVGYILTTVPLLFVAAVLSGATRPMLALLVSVLLSAMCLVIFRYGLSTVLPEGLFGIDGIF